MGEDLPVARVLVDVPFPHLDRPFDYRVPDEMSADAVPGARVKVRFSGRLVDGYVLERAAASAHPGRLARLSRVLSAEPVLSPEVANLCRAVADRWVGTMADVVRLAVPPRHARVEKALARPAADQEADGQEPREPASPEEPEDEVAAAGWASYRHGPALLTGLAEVGPGTPPRAVWNALPGEDWPRRLVELSAAALAAGTGSLVVVPDARDLARLDDAARTVLGDDRHVCLTADVGPAERYRRFLAVCRGSVRVVLGTRAACYAPVADLGLVVIWDDGDDLHCEPRAPYAHARDVLLLRAHLAGAAAVVAGFARTTQAQRLLDRDWAKEVVAARDRVRQRAPRVVLATDESAVARDSAGARARLPHVGFEAARAALANDAPVLVQVPRRGYRPGLSCQDCRRPARCRRCSGPVSQRSAHAVPACAWCGRPAVDWTCPTCAGRRLRTIVVGSSRTGEELGRAFPGVPVVRSDAGQVRESIGEGPCVVVCTPGAEPVAPDGYGACLLLDAWLSLGLPGLRAGEETLRRWLNAVALVRPAGAGGTVVMTAEPGLRDVQALVRWDPGWAARRELEERRTLGLPPAVPMVALTGTPDALTDLLNRSQAERAVPGIDLLGPVTVEQPRRNQPGASAARTDDTGQLDLGPDEPARTERLLLRSPRDGLEAVAAALRSGQGQRSARKAPDVVRIEVDPCDIM